MMVMILDSPMITVVFGNKWFFHMEEIQFKLLVIFVAKQPSTVIGKSYFTIVGSIPLLVSEIQFLQQTFIAFSCRVMS